MPTSPEVLPEKCAYLTFDDGPSENTLRILDILDRYGVKATFFVIKNPAYASFYSEILKRGHSIGLHSSSHSYKTIYSSVDAFMYDLGSIQNYVYEQTGQRPVIMRFPGGSSNTVSNKYCRGIMGVLIGEVSNKGFIYHDWNVDSGDATDNNVPPATLVANISKYSEGKATIDILMHDTGSAKETTIQALPQIIEYLQANGYTILPISDQTPPIQHRSVA